MHSAFIIEAVLIIHILTPAQTAGVSRTTIQEAQMSKTGRGQEL